MLQVDGTGHCGKVVAVAAASPVAFPNAPHVIYKERWTTELMCGGRRQTVSSVDGRVSEDLKECVRFASMNYDCAS